LVALSVPMHTALHIGVRAAARLREVAPEAHLCMFGHYAGLNADYLLGNVADSVIAGETDATLVELAGLLESDSPLVEVPGLRLRGREAAPVLERLAFAPPCRDGLPELESYARLQYRGEERVAAAVEASRGCLHACRHCPIPPVYGRRFFVVPAEHVLADIDNLVRRGARHLSFADPDFLNGPGHVLPIVREMHRRHPGLTFDVTTKISNLLRRRELLPELAAAGCLFIVSAVESLADEVLQRLDKGHVRRDVDEALDLVSASGIALRPTWVPFTPWTRRQDYREMLDWIAGRGLVAHVDVVQYAIRLLVPPGSLLAADDAMLPHLGPLQPGRFFHPWRHPDPAMDALHAAVDQRVREAARSGEPADRTFAAVRRLAMGDGADSSWTPVKVAPALLTTEPPRLTEPWFC
jgi:radical SAM superfamily enzyme YgiQ (UPF0313 family)